MARLTVTLAIALAAVGCAPEGSGGGAVPERSVLVSAALSLTEAMTEIARAYQDTGAPRIELNFGASNGLAQQILDGAPVDLYVSADDAQMDRVQAGGRIRPGTRIALLSNQLVVLVRKDDARELESPRDLLSPDLRRVALGDPLHVPAGVYGRRYLESAGVWTDIEPRILPTSSVRAALVALESGSADAALAYRTDARVAPNARIAFTVPIADGPSITYPAAVVSGGANQEGAVRFLAFLRGSAAARIFERHGFIVKAHES